MSVATTHYVLRTEALEYIYKRKKKNASHKSNEWLENKLEQLVNNECYNFFVVHTFTGQENYTIDADRLLIVQNK